MLSDEGKAGAVPIIFLVTDGAVENERHICDVMWKNQTEKQSVCPRIYTFGIGIVSGLKLELERSASCLKTLSICDCFNFVNYMMVLVKIKFHNSCFDVCACIYVSSRYHDL